MLEGGGAMSPKGPGGTVTCTRPAGSRARGAARAAVAAGVALLVAASPVAAIINGSPDDGTYANTGAIVAQYGGRTVVDCSGILIAPAVLLTAAHCGDDGSRVTVTFDAVADEGAALVGGTLRLHPLHRAIDRESNPYDVAVVELDAAVHGVVPAGLPAAGYLDGRDLRGETFTTVGYGSSRDDVIRKGWLTGRNDGVRSVSVGTFAALRRSVLFISMNPARDHGGTCYGDSGGPHFDETGTLVSLTGTGDATCRATDQTVRLDQEVILAWLAEFLP